MTRMPTLRTIITHQNSTAPMAAPNAAKVGTSQPSPDMAPISETVTIRRTAAWMEVCPAANSPSLRASVAVSATVVTEIAAKLNSTPEAVPTTAWDRARVSRLTAARTSWAQNVATIMTRPIGRIIW